ncbi:hypothetical protein FKP32DRAFT_1559595 [Trametes sanguinea]|nr:hypothetical protein FKP32DRAFT_1559595 [Trametes sanguinea]
MYSSTAELPKALRQALENMPTVHQAELMLARIVEVIQAAEAEDGDIELGDPQPLHWAEGIEAYRNLTIPQMQAAFSLPSPHFPFFNHKTDMVGNDDPWSEAGREALKGPNAVDLKPFWHQWVGVMKIVDNMMSSKNILLMDQVGVGKTLQAAGTLAMYEWLRVHKDTRGDYPSRFREFNKRIAKLSLLTPSSENSPRGSEILPRRAHLVVCTPNLVDQWTAELHRYLEFGMFTILPYLGTCSTDRRAPFWKAVDAIPPESTVIILTTYSALKSDGQIFFKMPDKPPTSFDAPTRETRSIDPALRKITVYSRQFGVVIFDEAHTARKAGPTQISAAELSRRSMMAMVMTATPIVTSPMVCKQSLYRTKLTIPTGYCASGPASTNIRLRSRRHRRSPQGFEQGP